MKRRQRLLSGLVVVPLIIGLITHAVADKRSDSAATALWAEVDRQIAGMAGETGFDRLSPAVARALRDTPRENYIPAEQRRNAYANRPLPIGYAQTISQPLIVALMTEMAQVQAGDRVFELGTGSGYQAAILDALGCEVHSIEIIPELGRRARETLDENGHQGVKTRIGDGYFGWEEEAPFDAIIVTAASDHIPPPLIQQIKPGGRMIIPVGSRYLTQQLVLVERDLQGKVTTREIIPVTFVPLTGQR